MTVSSSFLRVMVGTVAIFLHSVNLLYGQTTSDTTGSKHSISGIVLDAETGEPIPTVNVYLSQTTIGTFTENDGTFEFLTELSGIYTLVFSYVGYKTEVREINFFENGKLGFKIELEVESLELTSLEVTASNKKWRADFEIFKRNFIGATGAALNTEIENPWVISFETNGDGTLIAQAENPLTIKNYTIGYSMQVDLVEFKWPKEGKSGYYLFYVSYSEMEPLSDKEQHSWKRNRQSIYLGSFEHFLKCLYENTLDESEFDVVVPNTNNVVDIPEIDSQTAARLGLYSDSLGLHPEEVRAYRLRFPVDVLYGQRRWFNRNRARSRIVPMANGGILVVTNRARLANPLSFRLDGEWANYRLANLLPENYKPED